MKRIFELPRIDISKFDTEDIITASAVIPNIDGGSVDFPEEWADGTLAF